MKTEQQKEKEWYKRDYVDLSCGVYLHYKGGLYLLLGIGQHSEEESLYAVYVSLSGANMPGPRIRIRPLSLFTDSVDGKKRFTYVGHDASELPQ